MKDYFEKQDNSLKEEPTIESMLPEGETVLWKSKPDPRAYVLSKAMPLMPIAVIWLLFDSFFIAMMIKVVNVPDKMWFFLVPFFLIHLAPVWIWIVNIVKALSERNKIEYALTQKRIVVMSGVFGVDFKFIPYEDINNMVCTRGGFDKILKVGDILVSANNQKVVIYDQQNPYELLKNLQQIVDTARVDYAKYDIDNQST